MLNKILAERKIPPLKSKEEMLEVLLREEYGYLPPKPDKTSYNIVKEEMFCAGKATLFKIEITVTLNNKEFTFPFYATIPTKEGKHPFFVCINFRDAVPDKYIPSEEIIDNGFAVLSFCYNDVTMDNNDMTDGLAGILYENGERKDTDAGKIAMWAWAAQRVMDYAYTVDALDKNLSIVCGHSRLGKTALLTAATDERFCYAHSNDSGCCGAAISRGKVGENLAKIYKNFPYWFSENFKKYINDEYSLPYDQHYLIASIAPRYVSIASAVEDTWADPDSEMLACVAASPMFEKEGKKGFICENRLPEVGDEFYEGTIGYQMRNGKHYFSREDWLKLIKFIKKHENI